MRDPERIGIVLSLLQAYWEKHPDLRLSQIIVNFAPRPEGASAGWVFHMEDDDLIDRLEAELEAHD